MICRDFFVFGESYGGKYVPDLAHVIHNNKFQPRFTQNPGIQIKLKGIGIGNGWMSPIDQGKYASFLYYHGMLDGEQYLTLLQLEEELIRMVSFLRLLFVIKLYRENPIFTSRHASRYNYVLTFLHLRLQTEIGMDRGKRRIHNSLICWRNLIIVHCMI